MRALRHRPALAKPQPLYACLNTLLDYHSNDIDYNMSLNVALTTDFSAPENSTSAYTINTQPQTSWRQSVANCAVTVNGLITAA